MDAFCKISVLCGVVATLIVGPFGVGAPLLTPSTASAAPPAKHVSIALLSEKGTIGPGEEVWVALKETIEPHWHTYWTNPGDSGEAINIRWQLPEGFTASETQWPIPSVIPIGPLANYGYSDQVLLLAKVKAPARLPDGPIAITAEAEWLVCRDICVPESGSAALTLNGGDRVGHAAEAIERAAELAVAAARRMVPQPFIGTTGLKVMPDLLELTVAPVPHAQGIEPKVLFFPLKWGDLLHAAPQPVRWTGDQLTVTLTRGDEKAKALDTLDGVLVFEESGEGTGGKVLRQGFVVQAKVDGRTGAAPVGTPAGARGAGGSSSAADAAGRLEPGIGLGQALLFALLGGVILNLMPCVFPVLSLKALSLARSQASGDADPKDARAQGVAYLAGVLTSFGVLAAALLTLRATGQAFGWGFQFQSPTFVMLLAGLFFVLGLSLSGVVTIGSGVTGTGDALTRMPHLAGSFFTGALATIASTPCTAPFMGVAVGFALAAPAVACLAVLLTMGLGFGLPMFALFWAPGLVRRLPKPGPWLETLKQALAFPLYGTAAWLVWVLSLEAGSDGVMAAMVLLMGLGFCAWLAGRTSESVSWPARLLPIGAALPLIVMATSLLGSSRAPEVTAAGRPAADGAVVQAAATSGGLAAQTFSVDRLSELRAAGHPVFVNLTAAWCITCKVNEIVALSSSRILAAFAQHDVVYLKGDWTRQDPEITKFLRDFGRAGVPLYVIYPSSLAVPPKILPQILTEAAVIDELDALTRPTSAEKL